MTRANEGYMDRSARMTVGIALLALGLSGTVTGLAGMVILVVGAGALVTGTVGYCPLYRVFGWNTFHPER